jgi:hypothetical protein
MAKRLPHNLTEIRRDWPVLGMYERFEAFVVLVLTLIIAAVILVALWRLTFRVVDTLVLQSLNPLEHGVFQKSHRGARRPGPQDHRDRPVYDPSRCLGGGGGPAVTSGSQLINV